MRRMLPLIVMLAGATTGWCGDGVVLLHGLCRSPAGMRPMERALRRAGFTVLNVAYPSRSAGIATLSEQTIETAIADSQLRDCPRIHFVTHSLGGMLVRSYFQRHRFDRLGRVVMLAPPNQGSEVVDALSGWRLYRWISGPAGGEPGTGADSVSDQLGPVTCETGIIAGDRSLNWINSLLIPGPDDGKVSVARTRVAGMKEHLVLHATHPFILRNRRAITHTIRFLQTGSFGQPSPPRPFHGVTPQPVLKCEAPSQPGRECSAVTGPGPAEGWGESKGAARFATRP